MIVALPLICSVRDYGTVMVAGSLHGPKPTFFLPTERARIQMTAPVVNPENVIRQPDDTPRCFQFSSFVGSVVNS